MPSPSSDAQGRHDLIHGMHVVLVLLPHRGNLSCPLSSLKTVQSVYGICERKGKINL